MIPRAYITAWRATAPWAIDAQVEQDLVPFLLGRGGILPSDVHHAAAHGLDTEPRAPVVRAEVLDQGVVV